MCVCACVGVHKNPLSRNAQIILTIIVDSLKGEELEAELNFQIPQFSCPVLIALSFLSRYPTLPGKLRRILQPGVRSRCTWYEVFPSSVASLRSSLNNKEQISPRK